MFSTSLLKGLAAAGAVSKLTARGVDGGYILFAQVGMEESPVKAYRGLPRVFRKLDAVASYVKELGLERFDVDVSRWSHQKGLQLR